MDIDEIVIEIKMAVNCPSDFKNAIDKLMSGFRSDRDYSTVSPGQKPWENENVINAVDQQILINKDCRIQTTALSFFEKIPVNLISDSVLFNCHQMSGVKEHKEGSLDWGLANEAEKVLKRALQAIYDDPSPKMTKTFITYHCPDMKKNPNQTIANLAIAILEKHKS